MWTVVLQGRVLPDRGHLGPLCLLRTRVKYVRVTPVDYFRNVGREGGLLTVYPHSRQTSVSVGPGVSKELTTSGVSSHM